MPLAAAPEPTVTGTVAALVAVGDRAFVRLADRRAVTICRKQVTPLVPLDRVLAVGMQVEGELDASGTRLHLRLGTPTPGMLDAMLPDGVVTPALVTAVGELGGELAVHPHVRVRISRSDVSSNPKDRVDTLLEVGETVPARVFRHSDGSLRLRLIDVDDDEPIQAALSLLPGGPEWVEFPPEPQEHEAEAAAVVEIAPPANLPEETPPTRGALRSAQLTIEAQRATIARLEREAAAARATTPEQLREILCELGEAQRDRVELARLLKEERAKSAELRKANRDRSTAEPRTARQRRERFPDLETWIRHEISSAWLDRVPVNERERYPLADLVLGDAFAASLEVLDDDRLEKAFRACVDVLTGPAAGIAARAVHPLRMHESGGAPERVREDGARCMRCAIENDTASARRLHYWKRRDGGVELSRVVLHEDMNP